MRNLDPTTIDAIMNLHEAIQRMYEMLVDEMGSAEEMSQCKAHIKEMEEDIQFLKGET